VENPSNSKPATADARFEFEFELLMNHLPPNANTAQNAAMKLKARAYEHRQANAAL
jgi:hypothetical protein